MVTGTVISSTAFNALTADLGTGLSTAITKDGQTVATALIPFAAGMSSTTGAFSSTLSAGNTTITGAATISSTLAVAGATLGSYGGAVTSWNMTTGPLDSNYGTSNTTASHWTSADNTGTVLNAFIFLRNTSTVVGTISTTTSATTYGTTSDYRLKDVTGPVTGAEAKTFINSLRPKQGSWKSNGSRFVGFLAHEFQEISPSSVGGEKDAVDENGEPAYQSMQASTSEVMANLVAYVQLLESRIAALEAK